MSPNELASFVSCCSVLGPSHRIVLVTHPTLDIAEFKSVAAGCGVHLEVELFEKKHFRNIHAYNCLMLDADFYRRFEYSKYILICQLDSFVFSDRLEDWCNKDYDYVGGPLFVPGSVDIETASVGNGGFSLRKTSAFIDCLTSRICPLTGRRCDPYVNWRKRIMYFLMLSFSGISKKARGFFSHWVDEDQFFSRTLKGSGKQLNTPSAREALGFSFDLYPELCLELSGGQLPMGCHQWHNNIDFWKQYIQL